MPTRTRFACMIDAILNAMLLSVGRCVCELNIPLIYHFSHNVRNDVYLFCFNLRRLPLNGTTVRFLFTVKFS